MSDQNNRNEFDLLIDLAKLIKKHGPEAFESLARQISQPRFSQHLVDILSTTARTSRTVRTGVGRSRRDFRSSLLKLERSEPDKGAALLQLYDGLVAKTLLPTLREMRAFASDRDLPPLKATSRDRAIIPFMKMFLPMSFEELISHLRGLEPVSSNDDRSLEGWSKIIFGGGEQPTRTREED